jgi:hypothetical protein
MVDFRRGSPEKGFENNPTSASENQADELYATLT